MAVELLKQAITAALKIRDAVVLLDKNKKECAKICDDVLALSEHLTELQESVPIMVHPRVHTAMKDLKEALETTLSEVNKCNDINQVIHLFNTKDIASKLERLKNNLSNKMAAAVFITCITILTTVQNTDNKLVSTKQELQQQMGVLIKHFGIRDSTDDASNENRTGTNETGGPSSDRLIQYSTWRQLVTATKLSTIQENIISEREGSSISVYKATLGDEDIAIKKFHKLNSNVKGRFLHELRVLKNLQHQNIIKLLGFCFEYNLSLELGDNYVRVHANGDLGFVSEYMSKKSMAEVIIKGTEQVKWPSIFRIINGIAKGVRYMHRQKVLHLDLKPENILLDDNMTPKINNFGKSEKLENGAREITLDEKNLPGTEVYVAPELSASTNSIWKSVRYFFGFGGGSYKASTKSDVYSFGIILLETMGLKCAKSSRKRIHPKSPEDWAKRMEENDLVDIFDPKIITDESQQMEARWCVIVGLLCCLPDPAHRPHMSKVISMLNSCMQQDSGNRRSSSRSKGKKASSSASSSTQKLSHEETAKLRCNVLTRDKLREQQVNEIAGARDLLCIPSAAAAVLLRQCRWSIDELHTKWFNDDQNQQVALCNAVNLPTRLVGISEPKELTNSKRKCTTCPASNNAGSRTMRSAGCSHYYCDACWLRHVCVALNSGMEECLSMRCPDTSCRVPVGWELVDKAADGEDKQLYVFYAVQSYVDGSGGRIKWCNGPGCNLAVQLLDGAGDPTAAVVCGCGRRFCWSCCQEPHQPLSCEVMRSI